MVARLLPVANRMPQRWLSWRDDVGTRTNAETGISQTPSKIVSKIWLADSLKNTHRVDVGWLGRRSMTTNGLLARSHRFLQGQNRAISHVVAAAYSLGRKPKVGRNLKGKPRSGGSRINDFGIAVAASRLTKLRAQFPGLTRGGPDDS